MWDEKARKVWVVEFDSGKPKALTMDGPGKVKTSCVYSGGALTSGPKDECADFESLATGIPSIRKGDEPKVPSGRDPRR